jgi:hypothetical protein
MPNRIVVATAETLGPRMAGPAIRSVAIARCLAGEGFDVEIVSTGGVLLDDPMARHVDEQGLRDAFDRADAIIFQGYVLLGAPWAMRTDKPLVVDLYDPIHLEAIEQTRSMGDDTWWAWTNNALDVLAGQTRRGDFFLCASERQRALWIGHLGAEGRVNPISYTDDPTLRRLIDVAPFGIAEEPPVRTGPGVRGVIPGIGDDDKVVLWGGGIYEWFDPLTLVSAIDGLRHRVPDVRLVFMGVTHPNPMVPEMAVVAETRALSERLGLTGRHVFFNEQWIPYDERQNVLLDADVAVTTHKEHIETTFSFRTRVLDYIWASRPIVTTAGDVLADIVAADGLGLVVPPGDVHALETALFRLLTDESLSAACRAAIEDARHRFSWTSALAPLVRFCESPHRAPDLVDPARKHHRALGDAVRPEGVAGRLRYDTRLARKYLSEGGVTNVVRRASGRARRALGGGQGPTSR